MRKPEKTTDEKEAKTYHNLTDDTELHPEVQGNQKWAWLVFSILLPNIGGFLMSLIGGGGGQSDWYRKLHKAAWNPPGWVFGPVWTTIYTLCGIAIWRIVQIRGGFKPAKKELIVYGVQLFVNMLWTPFFFGMHLIVVSFIWLLLIDVLVIVNIYVFYKVDKISAAMLVPYIIWGLFASTLSAAIVATN